MDEKQKQLSLIGYAAGFGGLDEGSDIAPQHFQALLREAHFSNVCWKSILQESSDLNVTDHVTRLEHFTKTHVKQVSALVEQRLPFTVIGGDHTAAIGTWNAVKKAISPLGLLWIDAHMDSHTPSTTETGRLHGMPLACLLGHGDERLTKITSDKPVLKPEHVCLLGVRSYESGEAKLLSSLGVRIFFMDEIKHRGLLALIPEILNIVAAHTNGFGISLDLDAIDPGDAPGVDVPESGGIHAGALLMLLEKMIQHPLWYGSEIVEYNPKKDINNRTANIMKKILKLFLSRI